MAKEICISSTPHETRLAILEDDQLAEIYYERENEYTLAGSIYNGRVTRVLPGMQSAFVDLGLERDAFLYVTDFLELEDQEETDELEKAAATGATQAPREIRQSDSRPGRGDDRGGRNGQKQEQKPETRPETRPEQRGPQDRGGRERRPEPPAAEQVDGALTPLQPIAETGSAGAAADESEARPALARTAARRGGRSHGGSPEGQGGAAAGPEVESETGDGPMRRRRFRRLLRAAGPRRFSPAHRLSLCCRANRFQSMAALHRSSSKTRKRPRGGARPTGSFKPATLIDKPIEWDGSGLLPGERSRGTAGRSLSLPWRPCQDRSSARQPMPSKNRGWSMRWGTLTATGQ